MTTGAALTTTGAADPIYKINKPVKNDFFYTTGQYDYLSY